MALWVFGYGSLIWRPGFDYTASYRGYIKGYRRVFHQGSTDHRGVPGAPGRVVTLEQSSDPETVTWGVAYFIEDKDKAQKALEYLEIREKQYDVRLRTVFFKADCPDVPAATEVLTFVASEDRSKNVNYLGPAPLDDIAKQVAQSSGPSGSNADYIFELESHFKEIGIPDPELFELADLVRLHLKGMLQTSLSNATDNVHRGPSSTGVFNSHHHHHHGHTHHQLCEPLQAHRTD